LRLRVTFYIRRSWGRQHQKRLRRAEKQSREPPNGRPQPISIFIGPN
jgi:hypothetical protein